MLSLEDRRRRAAVGQRLQVEADAIEAWGDQDLLEQVFTGALADVSAVPTSKLPGSPGAHGPESAVAPSSPHRQAISVPPLCDFPSGPVRISGAAGGIGPSPGVLTLRPSPPWAATTSTGGEIPREWNY